LNAVENRRASKVSFVATAFNEEAMVNTLMSGIFNQTRLPDEIILVDTGSRDRTVELLEQFAKESSIPFSILINPGSNIAKGRNLAISKARFPIIAVSDFGCFLPENWLEHLISPFEDDAEIQVSYGTYAAIDSKKRPAKWMLGWKLEDIKPDSHLPSAVSIAFRKEVWKKVGGYPEWLTMTAEDTYFALELKRSTTRWAFVPEASVQWIAPQSFMATLRKSYRWSIGDGEAGTNAASYRWALIKISALMGVFLIFLLLTLFLLIGDTVTLKVASGILLLAGIIAILLKVQARGSGFQHEVTLILVYIAEILGFMTGLSHRSRVDKFRMKNAIGSIFILAGVPIDDTGGGARWTQLTLEYLRRGYYVFFINKFPKYESKELRLEYRHPNLVTNQIRKFNWSAILRGYKPALVGKRVIGMVELPLGEFVPIIERIQSLGGTVIYDLLDAWETSLGGEWYQPGIEQRIIDQSDLHFATVPGLATQLASRTDKPVYLVPNAVNSYIFNPEHKYPKPVDFPDGEWIIIYIGALWGEWFDWGLLNQISVQYPDANLIVIGDKANLGNSMPSNVHFLGLKPQRDLPAYLYYSDIAIVPWKINSITQMTSPLKVFEYIAMYKPVVAPMIDPLKNIPSVFLAENEAGFIQLIEELRDYNPPKQEIAQFIKKNNWQARVDQILELAEKQRYAA